MSNEEEIGFGQMVVADERYRPIEIIDANTTKAELLEVEYDEVKANLKGIEAEATSAVVALSGLAKASQHPQLYAALASVIMAASRANREITNVINSKRDLILELRKDKENAGGEENSGGVVNNNLILTTTDLLRQVKTMLNQDKPI